jgi:peptidoglycan hydrolase-like protein with peptidoglycan-binding domain
MQKAIGISPADGIFGIGTDSAVREWQKANGLVADGIVGPATQAKMFG